MNKIQDKNSEPDMQEIKQSINGDARNIWQSLINDIESSFNAKPKITYSTCAAKPGWNVKYKKSGKALCTLYPEKESFTVLVVLGAKEINIFESVREAYTDYIKELVDSTKLFNGTKWLMIKVTRKKTAVDAVKLMHLKIEAGRK